MSMTDKQWRIFWGLKTLEVVGGGLWYWFCTLVGGLFKLPPISSAVAPDPFFDACIQYFFVPILMTLVTWFVGWMLIEAVCAWIDANKEWAVRIDDNMSGRKPVEKKERILY